MGQIHILLLKENIARGWAWSQLCKFADQHKIRNSRQAKRIRKKRHLSESQRAMVAASIADIGHGGDRQKQTANLQSLTSRSEAAEKLNVSERSTPPQSKIKKQSLSLDGIFDGINGFLNIIIF